MRIVSPDQHQARLSVRRLSLRHIISGAYCDSIPADCFPDSRSPHHFPIEADYLPSSCSDKPLLVDESLGLAWIYWSPQLPKQKKVAFVHHATNPPELLMDASMKCKNLLSAFICIFSYSILILAESSCDVVTYGTPDAKDCFDLLQQLPGGFTSPEIDVHALRSFIEPKFLRPAFAPIQNTLNTEMVQLPKIWKKCPYLTQASYLNERDAFLRLLSQQ